MSRTIYVTVKLEVNDPEDLADVINEMDYSFDHPAIVDTEIVDFEENI